MRTCLALVGATLLMGATSLVADPQEDGKTLRAELDRVASSTTTVDEEGREHRNAVVLVDSPAHSFTHTSAAGIGNLEDGAPMSPEHQFYVESLTKTFTATVVLQLAEEGRLGGRGPM